MNNLQKKNFVGYGESWYEYNYEQEIIDQHTATFGYIITVYDDESLVLFHSDISEYINSNEIHINDLNCRWIKTEKLVKIKEPEKFIFIF